MAITRNVYPPGISGAESFGGEYCYSLHPDIVNLKDQEPAWEVPYTYLSSSSWVVYGYNSLEVRSIGYNSFMGGDFS